MKKLNLTILLTVLLSMVGTKALAYDIAVQNADGVTIYYNYSEDGTELTVTSGDNKYIGNIVIPEEVTYKNRTRKVTYISDLAFFVCSGLTSVTIPNSVTSIGYRAFYYCRKLTLVTIGNEVTSIGDCAFEDCSALTSVTIPNSVTSIGERAFSGCSGLTSVIIPNSVTSIEDATFYKCCSLTSMNIGNGVTSIGDCAFEDCSALTSVTIPNSVTSIGWSAFSGCSGLTSVIIPNSVTSIGQRAFYECSGLTSVTIGNGMTSIGEEAFDCENLAEVISLIENPFAINGKSSDNRTFTLDVFNNATLYVPVGTKEKYKATEGWKDFLFIEEGTGSGGTTPEPEKCATPTIIYTNSKLTFKSATEGATCQYSITDTDISSGRNNEVELTATYHISVYATKAGYTDSDVATATLCWIDVEPRTEGIENGIAEVRALPVLIKTNGSLLTVEGADDGEQVSVFGVDGTQQGQAFSQDGIATINTSLPTGSVAIVKIGQKSVKVVVR